MVTMANTNDDIALGTAISQGYSAGNYANAYETTDLEIALESLDDCEDNHDLSAECEHAYRNAFVLGFFASYALSEIGCEERERFDTAYHSATGASVIRLGYCDSRDDDYAQESEEWHERFA
jgi:hypothetical protein